MLVTVMRLGHDGPVFDAAKPLIAHLSAGAELSQADRQLVSAAMTGVLRSAPAHADLFVQGDVPHSAAILVDGWAIRYRTLPDGRRQILTFLLPGDICVARPSVAARIDHAIAALTPVRYTHIAEGAINRLLAGSERIAKAFEWAALAELSMQREWAVSLGQRDARGRIAHLLCELIVRMRVRRLVDRDACAFPVTQCELAEALGLTAVHVNRTLQQLRKDGLISLQGRELTIHDYAGLTEAGLFDPAYLHLKTAVPQVA